MKLPLIGMIGLIAFPALVSPAAGVTLQEMWDLALPGEDYDRLVHLDSLQVYTGGLLVSEGRNCIHGHGAIIDLQSEQIRVAGYRIRLDVDGLVIMNGGSQFFPGALAYYTTSEGKVRHCVFHGNRWGLDMRNTVPQYSVVENCIFFENTEWGAVIDYTPAIPPVRTCLAFHNGVGAPEGGDWALSCGCPGEDPMPWDPPEGCLLQDPLFIHASTNPDLGDFHLQPDSPCIGSGTPAGVCIGAYQERPVPIETMSWGKVKGVYRYRLPQEGAEKLQGAPS